jgi:hypothetical protein
MTAPAPGQKTAADQLTVSLVDPPPAIRRCWRMNVSHERATARALKARLQRRLREAGTPAGDWSDKAFRLGKRVRGTSKPAPPEGPKGDWTDNAFRLGKAIGRGKRWLSK